MAAKTVERTVDYLVDLKDAMKAYMKVEKREFVKAVKRVALTDSGLVA